jgi:glycerol uptake facilitator-like aquaporin
MFGEELFQLSQHVRAGGAQLFSEFVATFGLLAVIWGCSRKRSQSVPLAVGLYITGAYWFTASTSFANPAVTEFTHFTSRTFGLTRRHKPFRKSWELQGDAAGRSDTLIHETFPALQPVFNLHLR